MTKFSEPWGFSKLDCYRECPQKFFYQFVKKMPQSGSPAMERGSRIHDDLEAYLRGWTLTLPNEALEWQEEFDALKAENVICEQSWGFDKNWNKLKDWFQPETWLRAKSDAHYVTKNGTLIIIDFKTGKYRVPSTEQLEIYALCGSAVYPEIETVTAEFWYIDADQTYTKQYTATHLKELRKKYEGYIQPMYNDEVWQPSPSRACKWCDFSKSKDGPCKF